MATSRLSSHLAVTSGLPQKPTLRPPVHWARAWAWTIREAVRRSLKLDPDLTVSRLEEIYPIAGYKNLDSYLDGLRKAGLPE